LDIAKYANFILTSNLLKFFYSLKENNMTVGEICNREVIVIRRDETILEAAKLMRQHHVGAIIVADKFNDRHIPIGIITDRDLVIEVLATGLDETVITVGDIMTEELFAVKESTATHEAIEFMRRKTVRRLPIIDDSGELVGILTLDDALQLLSEELLDLAKLVRYEQRKEIRHRP
jgi:predicted transcriptional regulator